MKIIYRIMLVLLLGVSFACTNRNNGKSEKEQQSDNNLSVKLSAEDIYKQSINKVAMVLSYKDGIPSSQGSGFFIDKNTLVTNYHCVTEADAIDIKMADQENVYKNAKVVMISEDYDLAIIKTKHDFPFLSIDSLGKEKIGSKIYAIGNPRGFEGTISDGILSGKRENEGIEFLQITAPISPGNSGGPVLNEKGKVIGVSTFTIRNSQNLNFAMPIKYISSCITKTVFTPKEQKRNYGIDLAAVSMLNYHCPTIGNEKFSLKNNTSQPILNIYGIIIYKTMKGEIFNFRNVFHEGVIPAGLARIESRGNLGSDYVYYKSMESYDHYQNNLTKFQVEFRLLSYEIEE